MEGRCALPAPCECSPKGWGSGTREAPDPPPCRCAHAPLGIGAATRFSLPSPPCKILVSSSTHSLSPCPRVPVSPLGIGAAENFNLPIPPCKILVFSSTHSLSPCPRASVPALRIPACKASSHMHPEHSAASTPNGSESAMNYFVFRYSYCSPVLCLPCCKSTHLCLLTLIMHVELLVIKYLLRETT